MQLCLGLKGLLYLGQFLLVCARAVEKLAGAPLLHDVGPDVVVVRSQQNHKQIFVNLGYPDKSQKPSEQYTIGNSFGTLALPSTKLLSKKREYNLLVHIRHIFHEQNIFNIGTRSFNIR